MSRRRPSLAWAMALALWAAAATGVAQPAGLLDFDIPSQPLEDALLHYGETTRLPALYPSDQMTGLRSQPLHGRYTPEKALQRLLAGTGLVPEKVIRAHGDVFRLKRISAPALKDAGALARAGANLNGFQAKLQAGVLNALCADTRTAPGRYRAMFQVSVDAAGAVSDTALLDSTGDADRDAALLAAVRRLHFDPPPAESVQVPYLVTLGAIPPQAPGPCHGAAPGAS